MNEYKELLESFAKAPEEDLAKSLCIRFADLAAKDRNPTADEVYDILCECRYFALGSSFAVLAIDAFWKHLSAKEAEQ